MAQNTIITFHHGLDTIGSNIVSLVKDGFRLITDFGAIAGVDQGELAELKNLATLYHAQKLPQVEGVYQKQYLENSEDIQQLSYEASELKTIILISHLHLDHIGSLGHLHPDIPVYISEEAYHFYRPLVKSQFLPEYNVNWQVAEVEATIDHGPFAIQFHLSDHDTPGAASIFIETEDVKLIYSGDIRLTGFRPDRVLRTLRAARNFEADILLLEGTTFSFAEEERSPLDLELDLLMERIDAPTEVAFIREADRLLTEDSHKLFAFNGYQQNIQRLIELAKLLQKHKKNLVLQVEMYRLMKPYIQELNNVVPLADEASSQQFGVSLEDMKQQPANYLLQVDEYTYQQLFDLPSGVLLHSNGVPLGSYMPLYEPYVREFAAQNWQFINIGVSGHASKEDILTIAYLINADQTVPWHSAKPDAFAEGLKNYGIEIWRPEYQKAYHLTKKEGNE